MAGVVVEVIDHLLAGPVLGVDAGVDDEADGAPDVVFEAAVVGVGVLIEADVFAEALGVKGPAFGVGRVVLVLAEFGNVCQLLGDGDLQVMAGNSFVIGDGFDVVEVAVSGVVGVDE